MTNHLIDHKSYLNKLKEIQAEDWVQHYLHLKQKPNFWTITEYGKIKSAKQRSAHEEKISKMIRWLLDPNETHGLGNIFAKKFIQLLGGEYSYKPEKNDAITALTEFRRIDVLYTDREQKVCIAIEVKQYAEEGMREGGKSQLDDYEKVVDNLEKNEGLKPYYAFLTPLKEESTRENWLPVGYDSFIDIIDEVYEEYLLTSTHQYVEEIKLILLDFRDELQRSMELINEANAAYINNKLSDEEKKYTNQLARAIESDVNSTLWEELVNENDDDSLQLEAIILLTRDYLHTQDKTPNEEVRILMRKIYNYLSGDKVLDLDLETSYKVKETETKLKPELIEAHGLDFTNLRLTRGKGQGMHIYHKDGNYSIYMSGDTHGAFPNDFIHLLPIPNPDKLRVDADRVAKGQFILNNNTILQDEITDKAGNVITFDELMEEYVLPAMEELNGRIDEL